MVGHQHSICFLSWNLADSSKVACMQAQACDKRLQEAESAAEKRTAAAEAHAEQAQHWCSQAESARQDAEVCLDYCIL